MIEFFSADDEFDESYTREQIQKVISHQYNEFSCKTIWEQAEMFCLESECDIYNREFVPKTKIE